MTFTRAYDVKERGVIFSGATKYWRLDALSRAGDEGALLDKRQATSDKVGVTAPGSERERGERMYAPGRWHDARIPEYIPRGYMQLRLLPLERQNDT